MKLVFAIFCLLSLSAAAQEKSALPSTQPLPVKKPATEGKIWGALLFGVDDAAKLTGSTEKAPEHRKDLTQRLAKAFPYARYEILGQHTQDVLREYESWVVPTRDLFLKVDSKGPAEGGGLNLNLQVWREQQVLVKTDAVLHHGSPLFIGGPAWRGGRLIFVLESVKK